MFGDPSRIQRLEFEKGRRIVVISDIHGNLPYFKALLQKISFSEEDILILDGDFLEKGPQSLDTLRYIMELAKHGNVYPVLGNCDEWQLVFRWGPDGNSHMRHYLRRRRYGLIYEMLCRLDVSPLSVERVSDYLPVLDSTFRAEWDFLSALPHAIETENYIFVHAGLDGSKPLEKNISDELTARNAFLQEGQSFSKWVVTGHWPVVLYGEEIVCANPIIDQEHHIICIDGGCVLKDDGQLNALLIPDITCTDASEFTCVSYDPFPLAEVLDHQDGSSRSYYIRWGDSDVRVLRRGPEFSLCRHIRTGYEMEILTKYLFQDSEITGCNDSTDYILPLEPGDRIGIVETTSRGVLAKHNGTSGWYYGRLKGVENNA